MLNDCACRLIGRRNRRRSHRETRRRLASVCTFADRMFRAAASVWRCHSRRSRVGSAGRDGNPNTAQAEYRANPSPRQGFRASARCLPPASDSSRRHRSVAIGPKSSDGSDFSTAGRTSSAHRSFG